MLQFLANFTPMLGLLSPEIIGIMFIWGVIGAIFIVAPFWIIISKAGFSGAWSLVAFIPGISYIFLWVFALSRWPIQEPGPTVEPKLQ